MSNTCDNKEIWKWILDQKDIIDLVEFAKKINLKVRGFRNIDLKTPKMILISGILKKVMKPSSKDDSDFPEIEEIDTSDKELVFKKIRSDKKKLVHVLEQLLLSKDAEKNIFAYEVYCEFVRRCEISEEKPFKYDTSLLLKQIDELEMLNNNRKIKEDEYLKQIKGLEKQVEKVKTNLQKRDNEIIKLNRKIISLTKDNKEISSMIDKIAELESNVEQKDLQIINFKKTIEERNLQIIDLSNRMDNTKDQSTIINRVSEEDPLNKNQNIGLWITKESIDFNKFNLKHIFITNLDTEETIISKLKNVTELWYIDYEISIFKVRKIQKVLRKNNIAIKLNKFINIQEVEVKLSKRS